MTYKAALEYIASIKFGLQGIQEDYGHDTNAFNYHAYQYYARLAETYQSIAKRALSKGEQDENRR